MEYRRFYKQLFLPVEREFGPLDEETLTGVVGFSAGGSLSLCTVGRKAAVDFITYVSCELAVRGDQAVGPWGPYELMMIADDEDWTQSVLTNIAEMSLQCVFEPGHTLDIRAWVDSECPVQAILFEEFAKSEIDGTEYGILRCLGVGLHYLELARSTSVERVIQELKVVGTYPRSQIRAAT